MEDEVYHTRHYLPESNADHILQMEPDSSIPLLDQSSRDDVCYPYHSSSDKTVQVDVLQSFINEKEEDNEFNEPEFKMERRMTAKFDDLLDPNIPDTERRSMSRRFSMYGDNVRDPSLVNKNIARYTFYSAELGSVKSRNFRDLLKLHMTSTEKPKTVADMLVETTSWWIDVFAPSNDEMRAISKIFRIHPLTTEDIQAQESREKCELFQNYMFISFRSFNHDIHSPDYLEAVSFYIIVFKDGVLTFRFQDLPHPHNVRRRIHQLKDFIRVTPEWINYALIDNITDSFAPLIQHTELEVDSIDDLVLVLNGSEQNDMLRRIGSCRKTVMQLMRLLGPKADVVRSLIKRYDDKAKEMMMTSKEEDEVKVHHEVTLYLGDIQDHILTMLQNVNHYDLILGRAHRNYIGQISIELSQAGNTTNEVINRLTFFATIIVPLNLVGGLFGMNVHVPGMNNTDLVWFFWIVLGMLIYVVAMVAIGKRTGFL
ncbi:cora-domain-containing protein, partial [Backusella circina FSU 941]